MQWIRRGRTFCLLLALSFMIGQPLSGRAQSPTQDVELPPGFVAEVVANRLDGPTAFAFAPDERIYVTLKAGVVRVIQRGLLQRENVIDLSSQVNQMYNRGLVGVAVHPAFPRSPYLYFAYVHEPTEARGHKPGGARTSRVVRVSVDPDNPNRALPDTMVTLLGASGGFEQIGNPDQSDSEPHSCQHDDGSAVQDCIPVEGTAHQANMLRFGRDGALYVGVGDGGEHPAAGLRAQDPSSLSGKLLRIHPITGAGYANNPFYDRDPNSNRSKVYQLGLRNPFRFAFHPTNSEIWIGDVGEARWEEVNRGGAGANFGWPCFEGPDRQREAPACTPLWNNPRRAQFPVHVFPHTEGKVAVTGGDFYTGAQFPTSYHSAYFFGEYNTGAIWTMRQSGTRFTVEPFAAGFSGLVQISIGPDGHLYLLSIRHGALYRIRYTGGEG